MTITHSRSSTDPNDVESPSGGGPSPGRRIADGAVILAGLLAIGATNRIGRWLQDHGHRMKVNAPPLTGNVDPRVTPGAALAVAVGAAGVAFAHGVARRLSWRRLLWAAFAATLAWGLALAAWDGVDGFLRSPRSPVDYLAALPLGSPGRFLSGFVDGIARYPSHVRAHPPGLVLLLAGMDAIGLRGPGWVAALELLAGAASVPAVLVAVREVAGEPGARRAAPFVAFLPAAVFWSSGDAVFLGISAWAAALLIVASGAGGRRAALFAAAGGALAGASLFGSYGLVLLGIIPAAVVVSRRAWRVAAVAAVPISLWFATFAATGFWWFDGLAATRGQYALSVARVRPYAYFLAADLAALFVALGPAVWVAVGRLRDRRLWLLVGGALAAVVIADLSGLSKAEVERIWLPFMPWIATATAATFDDGTSCRRWLGVNVAWTIVLQGLVWSPW